MTLDPTTLSSLILIGAALGAAFVAALWLSLIFWTIRDIRKRARDPLMVVLAACIVGILFLPGILIYMIVRPPKTIEEEYQHTLEEEALLQTIEEYTLCPGCGRRIREEWIACPTCHTELRKKCLHCGHLIELSWNICPFCASPAPGKFSEPQMPEENLIAPSTNIEI
ncbi:MAG: zinc ribbon domain-containing protein [Anaerolineae bacterium]|nr:zinc ribbon domain-containing protein [Anaerolineae bacterium]